MAGDPESSGNIVAEPTGSNATAIVPDQAERAPRARRARQASHMAPMSKKAQANLYRAERHAEQTGVFQVLRPGGDESPKPRHAAPAHSREAVEALKQAKAAEEEAQAAPAKEPEAAERNPYGAEPNKTALVREPVASPLPLAEPQTPGTEAGAGVTPPASPYATISAPKRSHTGLLVGILCGLAAVLVAVYVGVAFFFQNTFMPNTTLNGVDVSLQAKDEVAARNESELASYQLAVTGGGLDFPLSAGEAGLAFDGQTYVDTAIDETNPWTWPVTIWSPRAITSDQGTHYDDAQVEELVRQKTDEFNATATPPTDATIVFDDGADQFTVEDSQVGTQLDPAVVAEQVKEAVATLQPTVAIGEDALAQPAVNADDPELTAATDKANSYLDTTITLNMNGQEATKIDRSLIRNWVVIGEDLQPTLNTDAITEWGRKDLSQQLDTVSRDRTYTRADGKVVTVPGGTYGWSIDSATLAPQITEAVTNGTSTAIDVPVLQAAAQPPDAGGRDWGNRYIDVDLSEQYVRMYGDDGAIIWESPCVSGDVSEGHQTPAGVYAINEYFYKDSPSSTLVGYYPGTNIKEYESYVRYWMPFIDNNVGLHDADWRGSFGGSINQYDGSHGCVNLPIPAAAELCGLVNQGDVVVVHY